MPELLQWLTASAAFIVCIYTLAYIYEESEAEERLRLWRERTARARKVDRIVRGFIRSRERVR